ncbi:hypothetical protein [Nesterenkonia rhizosphaerae]|uniref:Uncharacterized protein n=1 Tax=Nesterenkonia rhizosphaerae TaxID=1348272 RepID=A0ABP9G0Z1_9MICC
MYLSQQQSISEELSSGGFRNAYYESLHPVLTTQPELTRTITVIGVILLTIQLCTIAWSYRNGVGGMKLILPLVGGSILALLLIVPTFTIPLVLGLIDGVIRFLAAIVGL